MFGMQQNDTLLTPNPSLSKRSTCWSAVMAERNIILCVGSRTDPHINTVQAYLRGINSDLKLILFNPLCMNHFIDITAGSDSSLSCVITTGEHRTSAEFVRAVWYRWLPRKFSMTDSVEDAFIAKDFALEEWKSVMQSMEECISRALWMNQLKKVDQIRSKAFQLKLARECGLRIPLTKITNDSASVQSFFASKPPLRVVSKPLTPLQIPPSKRVRPREITSDYAVDASSTISIFPGIFQELIEREVGLCVVVVMEVIFAARIRPKKTFSPVADNSVSTESNEHRLGVCKIPESLEKSILTFHRKAGLVFGVYDFLEIEDNEFVFLDCNPCGSWLSIEEDTGLEISKLVAETLVGTNAALKQFENL